MLDICTPLFSTAADFVVRNMSRWQDFFVNLYIQQSSLICSHCEKQTMHRQEQSHENIRKERTLLLTICHG